MNMRDLMIVAVILGAMIVSITVLLTAPTPDCSIDEVQHAITLEDLEIREGFYYKKFSNPVFTLYNGPVTLNINDGVLEFR